jgi:hypothetical protein
MSPCLSADSVIPWTDIRAQQWVSNLPYFCKPIIDDETSSMNWVDFWAVTASGDDEFDQFLGELIAEDALDYARRCGQAEFVDLVLVWIAQVTRGEFRPMEKSFIEHVIRNDPHCADRIMALVTSIYPQFRN